MFRRRGFCLTCSLWHLPCSSVLVLDAAPRPALLPPPALVCTPSTSGYTCSWTQLPQVLPGLCPKASACVWEGLLFAQEKDTKNLYDHKHLLVDFQKLLPVLQHVLFLIL